MFVVWEPILFSDWAPPSSAAQARIPDLRIQQFWDRPHALSAVVRAAGDDRVLGARRIRGAIVWDYVAVFPPGALWTDRFPVPEYAGAPVLDVMDEALPFITRRP